MLAHCPRGTLTVAHNPTPQKVGRLKMVRTSLQDSKERVTVPRISRAREGLRSCSLFLRFLHFLAEDSGKPPCFCQAVSCEMEKSSAYP